MTDDLEHSFAQEILIRTHPPGRLTGLMSLAVLCLRADQPCAVCHPKEVEGFARNAMGRSVSDLASAPKGKFRHAASGSLFEISYSGPVMRQKVTRGSLAAEYPVAYVVGSGNRAFSYLINVEGYLFQAPIGYYTQRRVWDMAPGFEQSKYPDFNRPATLACILCHSGEPRYVPGTLNRFEEPPFAQAAISCDRCHGPVDRHLAEPSPDTIVNPARLPVDMRDSVCEQCHLSGEARVLNPEKKWTDFRPGDLLETVFTVFVGAPDAKQPAFKVISHSEQLRRSMCWQKSGRTMWCGLCHDPHRPPVDKAAWYREQCMACHSSTLRAKHQALADCVSCHMPARKGVDSAHAAFTDHQISIHPARDQNTAKPSTLVAWRKAPGGLELRNLALAYVDMGSNVGSPDALSKGFDLLVEVRKTRPEDPDVIAGLALILYLKGRYTEAGMAFDLAHRLDPANILLSRDAANAWNKAGDSMRAIHELESLLQHDPSLESAALMLANIYRDRGEMTARHNVLERYLNFRPESLLFRQLIKDDLVNR